VAPSTTTLYSNPSHQAKGGENLSEGQLYEIYLKYYNNILDINLYL
jgi:hypothetical protein